MSDSNLFDQPWDDAPEEQLPPQAEHDLVIVGYEVQQTKAKEDPETGLPKPQRRMVQVAIKVQSPIEYQTIFHYLVFPNKEEWLAGGGDETSERTAKMMLRNVRRFLRVFKLDERSLSNLDHLEGAQGKCLISHRSDDKGNVQPQLQLPRARD